MQFDIKKRISNTKEEYHKKDLDIAYRFSKKIYQEFGDFLKAVILFGSTAKRKDNDKGDIDILVIVDDVSMFITREIIEAYKIITGKAVGQTSKRIHVTTLKFTSFWEYIRSGDPIGINMLRDGVAIIDTGFFDPLQQLLHRGRIRPTTESIWSYFARAPRTLHNSRWHLLQASIDLYWAVIDSAHAALMSLGEVPPSPDHVADLLDEKMVKKKLIDKKQVTTMRTFYNLAKMIMHREINDITGQQYENYHKEAKDFVDKMRAFIEGKKK